MYKFKMDDNYYITAEVLKDDFIEVTLYEEDGLKRYSYTFKIKEDKSGHKFFTCFNRDFYI